MNLNITIGVPGRWVWLVAVLSTALAFATCRAAFGQAEAGSISGTVHDSSGAVVAGAEVKVTSSATSLERSTQTASTGQYTVPGLLPGIYEVTISHSGFSAFKSRAEVTVGARVTLDADLSLSGQIAVVEVIAAGGAEVNTQSQEISQVSSEQQVAQLPSLTRNPYDFVAIAGNVSGGDRTGSGNMQTSGGGQNNTDRGVGFSLNGQRASGTEVLLDGIENTNVFDTTIALVVPQDAVQEFRVITNNFDAQYGRAAGGVINLTTKGG